MTDSTRTAILRCGAIASMERTPIEGTCPVHPDPIAHLCQCQATTVRLCTRWRWHRGPCKNGSETPEVNPTLADAAKRRESIVTQRDSGS